MMTRDKALRRLRSQQEGLALLRRLPQYNQNRELLRLAELCVCAWLDRLWDAQERERRRTQPD